MLQIDHVHAYVMTAVLSVVCISPPAAAVESTTSEQVDLATSDPVDAPIGVAKLRWSKPIQNSDGSSLANLAGYVIRYGTSSAALKTEVFVGANATAAQIYVSPGQWYFQIASMNTAGMTSRFSPTVSSTIR